MLMWAWRDNETGKFSMVYASETLVRMCSPDYFKYKEANNEGKVVQVSVEQLIPISLLDISQVSPATWVLAWAFRAAQDIYNMMWSVKCRNVKLPTVEMIAETIESYYNEDMGLDDNEQIA